MERRLVHTGVGSSGAGLRRGHGSPRRLGRILGAVLYLIAVVGCGDEPALSGGAAVTIDGEKIPFEEFRAYAAESLSVDSAELAEVSDDVWSALFDQFLDAQLLIRLAIERGLVEGEVDEAPSA